MKILMISDVYFPRVNGVSTSIQTFRRELARMGHEIVVVAPDYGDPQERDGCLIRVPARRVLVDPEDRMMRWRLLSTTTARFARGSFDVVHVQTPFVAHYQGVRFARRVGVPCLATYHTFFEEYLHHYVPAVPDLLMRRLARAFSRRQCNALDAVLVPSVAMREVLEDYGVDAPVRVVPTGIDMEEFRGGDGERFRRSQGIDPKRPVLLFVGRLAFEKNIDFLLRVLRMLTAELPDILLVIAGEGPAQPSLVRKAERLGLHDHVSFVGNLSRRGALLDCYRAADAFVFASRTETQGLVLLEAMALGVPVVAVAAMGTRDILRDGQGAIVAPLVEADFAGKLLGLLRDPHLRARLSAEAVEHARGWSSEPAARALVETYEGLVGPKRRLTPAAATDTPCR